MSQQIRKKRRTRERVEMDAIQASLTRYERLLRWYVRAKELRHLDRARAAEEQES